MENNFFRKHIVISTIIAIIGCFIISVMIGQLLAKGIGLDSQNIAGKYLQESFGKLFAVVITFVMIFAFGLFREIKTEGGGAKKVSILLGVIAVISAYNVIGDGIANRGVAYTSFHPEVLLACALYAFLTGVLEELVCRVLLFQNMCLKWKDKKHGVLQAVIVSSVVFGLCHLLNLPAGLAVTLFQVYYAIIAGIIFAVIYFVSRNIWVSILSHFLIDFCGVIGYAFMSNENAMALSTKLSSIDLPAVLVVVFMTIGAGYALSLIHAEKHAEKNPQEHQEQRKHPKRIIVGLVLAGVILLLIGGGYTLTAKNTTVIALPDGTDWNCELKNPDSKMDISCDDEEVTLTYGVFNIKDNELICTNNAGETVQYELKANGQMLDAVPNEQLRIKSLSK